MPLLAAGTAGGPNVRDRGEADRRSLRNSLLLSLHRVAVTELPQFEDLPLTPDTSPAASQSALEPS